jgi:hypothetical protein
VKHTCLRCGGRLSDLDLFEGLCASNDCFIIFLNTLDTLGVRLPASREQTAAWWRAAFQRISRQGHITLGDST